MKIKMRARRKYSNILLMNSNLGEKQLFQNFCQSSPAGLPYSTDPRDSKGKKYLIRPLVAIFVCIFFAACAPTYLIKENKTGKFEVGEDWPAVEDFFWKGMTVLDTTFEEGGYNWGVQILENEKGRVLIEEDFFTEGRINRIRVEHPRWKSQQDIRVGQSFGEVKEKFSKGSAVYLSRYQRLDLIIAQKPSVHYLFQVDRPEFWMEQEIIIIDKIPDSLKLTAIVIM